MSKIRVVSLAALAFACVAAQAQEIVGTLSTVREVKVTRGVFGQNNDYVDAHNGQPIQNRYGVRTLRRSRAEVNFKSDKSVLRINELTDLVVYDEATLRKVQLSQGEVWVKVAHGVNTSISTPTLTATARGTEYTVSSGGEVKVFEGSVAVSPIGDPTKEFLVPAGQKISMGANGETSGPTQLSPDDAPQGHGGGTTSVAWFNSVSNETGILISETGSTFQQLRTDPLNDPLNKATEGDLTVVIDRKTNRPFDTIAQTDPRTDLGLLDDTNSSYWFPAGALAATLALDYNDLGGTKLPAVEGTVFGFSGAPAFAGLRGDASGTLGRSTYGYEANVLQYYNDPTSNVLGRFASVMYMERPVAPDIQAFAGRMKFYEGPVFNDVIDTQLIADRYTAAGLKYSAHGIDANLAYVYDANRYEIGVQPGVMANVDYPILGGKLGGHLLETNGPAGTGHGRSVTLALPVVPNYLDAYGEYGLGVDGTTNETVGVYLPWLMNRTGVDLFFEYANKESVANAYSLTALYEVRKGIQLRASMDWINGTPEASIGAAIRF